MGTAALLAGAPAATGQEQGGALTLEGAARQALAWHPAIVQAAGELNARGEAIAEARAGYSPQVSAGLGSGFDNRVRDTWRPRPQVGASQMLYDFGKVRSAVDMARSGEAAGRAELLLAVDTLVRETGYAVIELQRNAALRQVAQDQRASVGAIGRLVQDRYETGGTTQSDALQAQARVEAAEAALVQIEAEQRRWTSNLAYLLGADAAAASVSPDAPEWLGRGCALAAAPDWDTVPAVMVADAQQAYAKAQLRRSQAERLPTVSLGGDASTDFASPFGDRSIYNFGLRLSGNVFGGGVTRARVRGADYAVAAAEAGAQRARLESRQRLAEAEQQIASLTRLTQMLATREAAMRETGKLYKLQYLEMGTRTLVDLLNAEQELHGIRFEAVNTAHDLRRLQLDCIFHSGSVRQAFGLAGTRLRGVEL